MDRVAVVSMLLAVARVCAFGAIAVMLVLIQWTGDAEKKRRRILFLFGYVIILHLGVGLARQRDAWPFTSYRLMHGLADYRYPVWRVGFFGIGADGREWRIDPDAWESISDWPLQWWFYRRFDLLPAAEKATVLQTLYERAEHQRASAAGRGRLPYRSFLGPFSAPQIWLFPRERAVLADRYRGIRVYYEQWTVRERLAGKPAGRIPLGEWLAR